MTWSFGYNLKWKLTKKLARKMKIRVERPEFLTFAVKEAIRAKTGVDFWTSHDYTYRVIICFHEHPTKKDLSDIDFSVDDIMCVMEALGLCRIPRWYSTRECDAAEQEDSSEDEGTDDFLMPSEKGVAAPPPVPVRRSRRPKVESSSGSDDETETEGIAKAKMASKARQGRKGKSVEKLREDIEDLKI